MIVAILLILVAVGTVVFHFASPWWWTPIAANWGYIDDTIILTFLITGVVFIAVILFMAYCIVKFRYKEGNRAEYEPENKKLEWWLTILTGLGVAGMLIPGCLESICYRPERCLQNRSHGSAVAMEFSLSR